MDIGQRLERIAAAGIAGVTGLSSFFGKIFTGWLLDRWHGSRVATVTLAIPALGFFLLLKSGSSVQMATLAVAILGYVMGAELQLCTDLTGRYGGLRSFGKIFGVMSGLIALGIGIGPVVAGAVFDRFGSYAPTLTLGIPLMLICSFLVSRLGPYPQWQKATDKSA